MGTLWPGYTQFSIEVTIFQDAYPPVARPSHSVALLLRHHRRLPLHRPGREGSVLPHRGDFEASWGKPGVKGNMRRKYICIYRLTGLYISIHACICIETWKMCIYIYIDMDTHLAKWRNCKYKWKIFDMLYCSRKVYRKLNILIRCWRTVYTVEVLEWTYFTYLFTHVDERVGYKQHWICFLQTCH